MAKLLIVDDEEKIRTLIKKYAVFEGYEVVEAANGFEAIAKCASMRFDLILMDIMMPELDGYSAVKEIRKTAQTPVIMLSAKGEEYDRIHGFEIGVDDYVVKPFSVRELMMRITAIIKRTQGSDLNEFTYKGLKISFSARTVSVDGEKLHLSPKEYDLLFYLVKNKGIALSREQCLSTVWGYDFYGDDRTLDTHIKTLRKNLGAYGSCIVTCRGVGYRFETEE
ncbi:response regulator transcription factor [Dielma fastidiosa]|uniref:Response regulator transcription factor n=1 Tax=Dielma fastidiosa TaxID=1034346 RepID=A0AB35UI36_9FIRM|nr:response regulator transcription factor [Dielma fastidiosa]MDY5167325.1 response regulator transcription factor [Dielma fastidiosa]